MPSKPTSSARAYCSWYSLYSTCAFMGSKWVLGKPRRPESYLLRSSSVTYPLGCSENQKTSTCSVGRRSCSTISASCLLGMVTGISRSHSLSPEYVPVLVLCQSTTKHERALDSNLSSVMFGDILDYNPLRKSIIAALTSSGRPCCVP